MHIGIDASRANVPLRTGTEWYSFFIIKELLRIDQVNKYTLYVKSQLVPDMLPFAKRARIRILRWPPQLLWSQLRLSLEMFVRPPDILFVPAHTIPIIHPQRVVTTCHDVGFERYPALYSDKPIGSSRGISRLLLGLLIKLLTLGRYRNNELDYHRFSMKLAINSRAKILTVSEFTKREITDIYHIDKSRIRVVHLGINPAFNVTYPSSDIDRVLDRYNILRPYIYFIGRWEVKKGIKHLLAAFQLLCAQGFKHRLVLAGRPGWGFSAAWSALPESVQARVSLVSVPHADSPLIMSAAEAFVFPSEYEGFGLPILEAMASGVPVVAADRSSLPEIAGGAALLVDTSDQAVFARAIRSAIENPQLRQRLINLGKIRSTQFSWAKTGQETHRVIIES